MTLPDDLTEARHALELSLATLIHVGECLGAQAAADHLLRGPGDGTPARMTPLHEAVTTAVRHAHNTLDRTDPAVPESSSEQCVECGSARVTHHSPQGKPFCRVCADGRGPAPQVMPDSPPSRAATSPYPRCERCRMPHDPDPRGAPAQMCAQFFAQPGTPTTG